MHRHTLLLSLLSLLFGVACDKESSPADAPAKRGEAPDLEPAPAILKRLTQGQYQNTLSDLFGEELVLPTSLEPDEAISGLFAVGAGVTTISARGVEQYEEAALDVAAQVMASAAMRDRLVGCAPAGVTDDGCAAEALADLGYRAWRRPLVDAEVDLLVDLSRAGGEAMGDFYAGLEFALIAILESPYFLYRVELGEADPETGGLRYTDYEMASRLSHFLWNTTPDDALLAAAAAGALTDDADLEEQVDRMLADPRARVGVRNFFTEMLELWALDELTKDPDIFVFMTDGLGASAREETLLGVEHLVFEDDGDYRDLMTTQRAWLDRTLATLYDIQAPAREGFGETTLPEEGGRRGFMGQVSFLALQAHAVSSSVTLRGKFIREVLLCQSMPSPPSDVDTSIPPSSSDAPTMRDRVAVHLEDPTCAACHMLMDPIGLGLENFDGLGVWRTYENDVTIDPSGDLDGALFDDAWGLAGAVREHEDLAPCLVETVYRYAGGNFISEGEWDGVAWHAEGFALDEHRVLWLLRDVALGAGFRRVRPPSEALDTGEVR